MTYDEIEVAIERIARIISPGPFDFCEKWVNQDGKRPVPDARMSHEMAVARCKAEEILEELGLYTKAHRQEAWAREFERRGIPDAGRMIRSMPAWS